MHAKKIEEVRTVDTKVYETERRSEDKREKKYTDNNGKMNFKGQNKKRRNGYAKHAECQNGERYCGRNATGKRKSRQMNNGK